jgi:hypothetical protein
MHYNTPVFRSYLPAQEDREQCEEEWLRNIKLELNNLGLGFI